MLMPLGRWALKWLTAGPLSIWNYHFKYPGAWFMWTAYQFRPSLNWYAGTNKNKSEFMNRDKAVGQAWKLD